MKAALVPLATTLAFLLAPPSPAGAGEAEGGVRVVLPLQLENAAPDQQFERVDPDANRKRYDAAILCALIAGAADAHGLPRPFFARLIWKESRFDIDAVSPKGAQGVAQFTPATAMRRGLRDAFDPEQALPASAAYLADLRRQFGNLGLAAAAYNAGEDRVSDWLNRDGYLPGETQDFVLSILGKPPETFRNATSDETPPPLSETKSFDAACRELPAIRSAALFHASSDMPPWGVQLAGNFDRTAALEQFERLRARFPTLLGDREPAIFAKQGAIGRRPMHVVQIAAGDRKEANDLCNRLRIAGGSCVVVRN